MPYSDIVCSVVTGTPTLSENALTKNFQERNKGSCGCLIQWLHFVLFLSDKSVFLRNNPTVQEENAHLGSSFFLLYGGKINSKPIDSDFAQTPSKTNSKAEQ